MRLWVELIPQLGGAVMSVMECLQDYYNLVDVYLDAVLQPRCVTDPKTFAQEGWHYELDDAKVSLLSCFSSVVPAVCIATTHIGHYNSGQVLYTCISASVSVDFASLGEEQGCYTTPKCMLTVSRVVRLQSVSTQCYAYVFGNADCLQAAELASSMSPSLVISLPSTALSQTGASCRMTSRAKVWCSMR